MPKIFKEHGGVILIVIVIVALITTCTLTVGGNNGGWIGSAFNSVVDDTHEKAGAKIDSITAGGNSANIGTLAAGLYDADDNMIMSWDEIVTAYPDAFSSDGTQIKGASSWSYLTDLAGKLIIDNNVVKIDSYTFRDCTSLTNITIPNGVTDIGRNAFNGCTSLKEITIPDDVTSIGPYAFSGCASLKSITLPNSITSIDVATFYNCVSLTNITIPDGITSIAGDAFNNTGYYNNTDNWENNVLYIGNYLIDAKSNISGEYVIKDGTKVIASGAFRDCTSLKEITIPDDVTSIGGSAFYNTRYYNNTDNWENNVLYIGNYLIDTKSNISGEYVIKDGTKLIADYAFNGCTSLKEITIPDDVTSIGPYAFSGCNSLTSITIPNSVTSIGKSAFSNCKSLTSVTIPNSVTNIAERAFWYCTSLTDIQFNGTKSKWNSISIGSNVFYGCPTITIHCTDGDLTIK